MNEKALYGLVAVLGLVAVATAGCLGPAPAKCGDGVCNGNETTETCREDCGYVFWYDNTFSIPSIDWTDYTLAVDTDANTFAYTNTHNNKVTMARNTYKTNSPNSDPVAGLMTDTIKDVSFRLYCYQDNVNEFGIRVLPNVNPDNVDPIFYQDDDGNQQYILIAPESIGTTAAWTDWISIDPAKFDGSSYIPNEWFWGHYEDNPGGVVDIDLNVLCDVTGTNVGNVYVGMAQIKVTT